VVKINPELEKELNVLIKKHGPEEFLHAALEIFPTLDERLESAEGLTGIVLLSMLIGNPRPKYHDVLCQSEFQEGDFTVGVELNAASALKQDKHPPVLKLIQDITMGIVSIVTGYALYSLLMDSLSVSSFLFYVLQPQELLWGETDISIIITMLFGMGIAITIIKGVWKIPVLAVFLIGLAILFYPIFILLWLNQWSFLERLIWLVWYIHVLWYLIIQES